MAGRANYSQAVKDRCLAALMASAVEAPDGSREPQFRAVARAVDVPRSTLQRWWKSRNRDDDGPLRDSSTRARAEVREEGAKDWLESQVARVKHVVGYITDPLHYSTELVEVPFATDKVQLKGTRPDHAARAMKLTVEVLAELDKLLTDDVEESFETREEMVASLAKNVPPQLLADALKEAQS